MKVGNLVVLLLFCLSAACQSFADSTATAVANNNLDNVLPEITNPIDLGTAESENAREESTFPLSLINVKPSARGYTRMVYDSERQVLVLWGGRGEKTLPNDTWEYDGQQWNVVETASAPPGRTHFSMVYDPQRELIVVCCGVGNDDYRPDAWEFDGEIWRKGLNIDGGPETALVYTPELQGLLLFVPASWGGETFLYDGEAWRRLTTTLNAESTMDHVFQPQMIYDRKRQAVVLLSVARGTTFELYQDTWQPGAEWQAQPRANFDLGIAYDDRRELAVIFGGLYRYRDENGELVEQVLDETWEYDGERWIEVAPVLRPSSRYGHAMAYDELRGVVVIFGGIDADGNYLSDTWEYDGLTWTQK